MNWLDHVCDAITNGTVDNTPWPHLVVENVFPAEFFQELREHKWDGEYKVLNPDKPQRSFVWLTDDAGLLPEFWVAFRSELLGTRLNEVVCKAFGLEPGTDVGGQVVHDMPEYFLGPHVDMAPKIVTGLFYLAANDLDAQQGTVLLQASVGLESDGSNAHDFGREFTTVKLVPYLPNTALFFPVTPRSFHAVERTSAERWLIAYDVNK